MALPSSWGTGNHPTNSRFPPRAAPTSHTPPPPPADPLNPTNLQFTASLSAKLSPRLRGDKILLPHTLLQSLLSAASSAATSAATIARAVAGERSRLLSEHEEDVSWESHDLRRAGVGGSGARDLESQLLPHPIIFKIYNPDNNRYTHAVPREFSAKEGEVVLSEFLADVLGVSAPLASSASVSPRPQSRDGSTLATAMEIDDDNTTAIPQTILNLIFKPLPKGTYVRLRPLAAGYAEEDWKALLERELRLGYSTLTVGEVLTVTKPGHRRGDGGDDGGGYKFLIDKVLPEGSEGICVVDTDVEVDIEPLSEEQARETLRRQLEANGGTMTGVGKGKGKMTAGRRGGKPQGGVIEIGGEMVEGVVGRDGYVDFKVPLKGWSREKGLVVELMTVPGDDEEEDETGGNLDLLVSTSRYCHDGTIRRGPRMDEWVWAEMGSDAVKRVFIGKGNIEVAPTQKLEGDREEEEVKSLNVAVHGYKYPDSHEGETAFRLHVSEENEDDHQTTSTTSTPQEPLQQDQQLCPNCHQKIPKQTFFLHTNFCQRNNVLCSLPPRSCGKVFKRGSPTLANHWHCPHCDPIVHGNNKTQGGLDKHTFLFHTPSYTCQDCDYSSARGISELARHRITTCPGKLILCRFCHLLVPQGEELTEMERLQSLSTFGLHHDSSAEILSLTRHERDCGGRTTDCHLCGKLVKLAAMKAHLSAHDAERKRKPKPTICRNWNCARTVGEPTTASGGNPLGLCTMCFGPLYAPGIYDPTSSHLRKRLERKIQTNSLVGCKRTGCENVWCKTGRETLGLPPIAGGMKGVKEMVEREAGWSIGAGEGGNGVNDVLGLRLCVDKPTQQRRKMAEVLAAEGGYDVEWGIKAVEVAEGKEDEARAWLGRWGVRVGEV